jgi:chromosome segregation ATPase
MAQFPLTVAAMRLGGISLYTLRQWCEKAEIDLERQRSLADPRAKWLSEEQLLLLAAAHGRALDQPPTEPELIPPAAYKLMMEQVAQALQQYEVFSGGQAILKNGLAHLVAQSEAVARQLSALKEADQELVQHSQELLSRWETTRAALEVVGQTQKAEKQDVAQRFEEVLHTIQFQETRLGEIEAANRQQADLLAALHRLQQEMQAQAQQAEQRLQASFQEALAAFSQQSQADQEQRLAALLVQIQPLIEAATATAQAAQVRAEQAGQRAEELAVQLQTEKEHRQKLEELVKQPGEGPDTQPSTRRKPRQKKADS